MTADDEYDEDDDDDDDDEDEDDDNEPADDEANEDNASIEEAQTEHEEPRVILEPPWSAYPPNRQGEFLRRREWFVNTSPDYPPARREAINPRFRREPQRRPLITQPQEAPGEPVGAGDDDGIYSASTRSYHPPDDPGEPVGAGDDDGIYSASTRSYHPPDDESIDSFDSLFRDADFPRILADLELIRRNGRIRLEDGSYEEIDEPENWVFTEQVIRNNIRNYPDCFLRRYFQEPWPNFH
jgi:hypothetical protein